MKSIVAAIVTVMTASLLALGVAPAQANHYGPDVATNCNVFAKRQPMRAGNSNNVVVRWRAQDGTTPRGTVRYAIINRRSKVVVSSGAVVDGDGKTVFRTRPIPRGRYRVRAIVEPNRHRYTNARCSSGLRAVRG